MGILVLMRRCVNGGDGGGGSTRERRRVQNRQGRVFCRQCDTRIATCLLNLVHILITLILMIPWFFNSPEWDGVAEAIGATAVSTISIFAAMNYLLWVTYLCTFGMLVLFVFYAFTLHLACFVLAGVIIWVQVTFSYEMREGIMSEENYANEEFISDEGRQTLETAHVYAADLAASTSNLGQDLAKGTQDLASRVATDTKETTQQLVRSTSTYIAPAFDLMKPDPCVEC
jgi:hypothetical protein